ncbi:MAG: hypothetical protein ACP5JT_03645 [Thermoplasmata archaeon]|jgi:predicted transcriptional regulator
MVNKKSKSPRKKKKEEDEISEEEEYQEFLENLLAEFTLAFLKDMERHGIFDENEDEEFQIKEEFLDKIIEKTIKNMSDSEEIDDVAIKAIVETLDEYYEDENLSEEEMYPRAEIVLSYVLEDVEKEVKNKKND